MRGEIMAGRGFKLALLAGLAWCTAGAAAFADPPANLDARVEAIRQQVGVPGMAVTIVENGQITYAHGFGVRRLGGNEHVDADTIFHIGSISKAFTTAAIGILVDQGKLNWDDKVIDHMPWFQMYDPWVTREMTVRDLLVHRSGLGLGEGDLMFVPRSNLSRREIVRRLRYLRPATSFRSGYAYDNVLYIAAGQLIEEVSGQSWEDFVRDNILRPAGMRTATDNTADRRRVANRAWPHARNDGPMHGMGTQVVLDDSGRAQYDPELAASSNPAGAIAASANDMGHWIALQLAHGALPNGQHVFSEAASHEMWLPQVHIPIGGYPAPVSAATPQFHSDALGWTERDYRGHRLLMHTGAVIGQQAILVLIPDRNVGFAVMINCEDGEAALGVAYELLDHYLGADYYDWSAAWQQFVHARDERAVAALQTQTAAPAQAGPSLPLASYTGDFVDPWYGPISITQHGDKLMVDFKQTPGMSGEMTHWQYDTFRVVWGDPVIEPAYMTFNLGADGKVDRIRMRAVSPQADFSFDYQDLDFTPAAAHTTTPSNAE
jgi:CubicO group peptidase (beta-lactamase class C family)